MKQLIFITGQIVSTDIGQPASGKHTFHNIITVCNHCYVHICKRIFFLILYFPVTVIHKFIPITLDETQFLQISGTDFLFFTQRMLFSQIQHSFHIHKGNKLQLISIQIIQKIGFLTSHYINKSCIVFSFSYPPHDFLYVGRINVAMKVFFIILIIEFYKSICQPGTGRKGDIQPLCFSLLGKILQRPYFFHNFAGILIYMLSLCGQLNSSGFSRKKTGTHGFFQRFYSLAHIGLCGVQNLGCFAERAHIRTYNKIF